MLKIVRGCLVGLILVGGGAAVQASNGTQTPPAHARTPPTVAVTPPPQKPEPPLTEIPGKATTERLCSQCHTMESAIAQRHTREEWNGVIERMIGQGLVATDDELYEVSDYLAKNYGPPPA